MIGQKLALTDVTFDGLAVSKLCAFRIKTGGAPCLSLAEQVPATIQHNLNFLETLAIGVRRRTLRFPLEKFVLLVRKLVDMVSDLLVVHEASLCLFEPGRNQFVMLTKALNR
jgi:hypothetical protein